MRSRRRGELFSPIFRADGRFHDDTSVMMRAPRETDEPLPRVIVSVGRYSRLFLDVVDAPLMRREEG